MPPAPASPLSFLASVDRLPRKGMEVVIEANAEQCQALARAHRLLGVEAFSAKLLVAPCKASGVRVTGKVTARIVQECVVTLQPLVHTLDEPVSAVFAPVGSPLLRPDLDDGGEMFLDPDGPDAPEPFSGGRIDIGALAEEYFALGLDPYPRAAGAELPGSRDAGEGGAGPLADALRALKRGN